MALAKRTKSKSKRRSARRVKRNTAKFKWPKAFRIVPIRSKAKPRPHAHLLGQAGEPPCPPNSSFNGFYYIGSLRYCCYLGDDGLSSMLQC